MGSASSDKGCSKHFESNPPELGNTLFFISNIVGLRWSVRKGRYVSVVCGGEKPLHAGELCGSDFLCKDSVRRKDIAILAETNRAVPLTHFGVPVAISWFK